MYWSGGRWADLGLAHGTLLRGLRWAPVLIGIVAAGYAVAAALPLTRGLFEDQRPGLFDLWPILPSLGLADAKRALGGTFGHSVLGVMVVDAGAVLFTALAGCLFCELRRRSTSLPAPMGLHWATNALGYVFGFLLR